MDQLFQILNIDKRQWICRKQWGRFFDDGGVEELITVRRMRSLADFCNQTDCFSTVLGSNAGRTDLGALSKVPTEVIYLIVQALPSLESTAMFTFTNSQLLAIGYPILSQRLAERAAPWAYDRILCIGDWCEDLPKDCISKEEERTLLDALGPKPLYYDLDGPFNLPILSHESFTFCELLDWQTWAGYHNLTGGDERRCHFLTTFPHLAFEPIKSKVLINVTKKEYIRDTKSLEFSTTLPPLISWGVDPDEGKAGPWAGDRLAIIPTVDFTLRMKAEEGQWTDFTSEGEELNNWFVRVVTFTATM